MSYLGLFGSITQAAIGIKDYFKKYKMINYVVSQEKQWFIQTKYQYSDRELVDQLTENPYYQYFIGLPGYQEEPPIDASTLVLFRKRLKMDVIMEANEYMLEAFKEKDASDKKDDSAAQSNDANTSPNSPNGVRNSANSSQSGQALRPVATTAPTW